MTSPLLSTSANGSQPQPWRPRKRVHLLILFSILLFWESLGWMGLLNVLILPPPSSIFLSLFEMYFVTGVVYWHLFVTLVETMAGFLIGAVIGLGLAAASALSSRFERYVSPYAVVFNVTPGIALAPFMVAWFGFGWSSKIALAALVCFFPVFVNGLTGLQRTNKDSIELFKSMGASRLDTFFKLRVPSAFPMIIAGLKLGMTGALVGAIVAEFSSASEGMGVLMRRFSFQLDIASSIATLLSMSLIGVLLYALMESLDRNAVFWKHADKLAAKSANRSAKWQRRS